MLTAEQLELLEQYLDADPQKVALKTGDRLVAEQVAVLQKAKAKLPSFYDARCFIAPISYEQSTSEIIANNRRFQGGQLAIDLTCGLGVDALAMAKMYEKVVACEIDAQKADIARHNFKKLGVDNVEVKNMSAEDFLTSFSDTADLIFCDPSRRSVGGSKVHALQDCAPNIIDLWPILCQKSRNIMVKLSPLFDVAELYNIFGSEIEVETISHNNECKEVVMRWGEDVAQANHLSICVIRNENVWRQSFLCSDSTAKSMNVEQAKYIYIPDVALAKSRTVAHYMEQNFKGANYLYDSYLLSNERLEGFVGRGFKILAILAYKPKEIKRFLASEGWVSCTVHMKNFPFSLGDVKKQLGIYDGSGGELFCFRLNGVASVCVASVLN